MTLQEQVCTREQAQRLKELGCKQESYFRYVYAPFPKEWILYTPNSRSSDEVAIAAYTVAELGEMLVNLGETEIDTDYENGEWTMAKGIETIPSIVRYIWHPTEAQARAALLIHILEKEKEHD